ncbi:RluA family pseudouridine synthase [Candidatus Peregrinibacteria bacterium]|nr:RluA family pseudouridine synthase [Candidatus Peregrinibacteria bacterium]
MNKTIVVLIDPDNAKLRIDKFLAKDFKRYSRSCLQKLILENKIKVNGSPISSSYKLKAGDKVALELPIERKIKKPTRQRIPLKIIFENNDLAVINKPAGMVVHASEQGQHLEGALVNALLYKYGKEKLSDTGGILRPGIVHRLDKDTSGLIIIAKNNRIHKYLVNMMKNREIEKKYIALLVGHLNEKAGLIDSPLIKSSKYWGKIILATEGEGRDAKTLYNVLGYFSKENYKFTLIEAQILTGRTHQIRVHFSSIGYPIAGDFLYGNKKTNEFLKKFNLKRQFLHAENIKFTLPDGKILDVKTEIPADLKGVLKNLESD